MTGALLSAFAVTLLCVGVCERVLHAALGIALPLGVLDISFYRDDFDKTGLHPQIKPTKIPFEVEGRHIILVDDVLYTGRTVRGAMNELFDYGRPASISLAVAASTSSAARRAMCPPSSDCRNSLAASPIAALSINSLIIGSMTIVSPVGVIASLHQGQAFRSRRARR